MIISEHMNSTIDKMIDYFRNTDQFANSDDSLGCVYINSSGHMCAIGCVMPDARDMEDNFVDMLGPKNNEYAIKLGKISNENRSFLNQFYEDELNQLSAIQCIHDGIARNVAQGNITFDFGRRKFLEMLYVFPYSGELKIPAIVS